MRAVGGELAPGARPTSRSTSLPGWSSLRATLPNTRPFDAWRLSASDSSSARNATKRSPIEDLATKRTGFPSISYTEPGGDI